MINLRLQLSFSLSFLNDTQKLKHFFVELLYFIYTLPGKVLDKVYKKTRKVQEITLKPPVK